MKNDGLNRSGNHRGFKHGGSHTPEYKIWLGMLERCYRLKSISYYNYGGRGVTVHQSWRESFTVFITDVGPRPSTAHSLDRFPNQNGNYEPGNVRWATRKEQARNRRDNSVLTVNSETRLVVEWAELTGKTADRIRDRLKKGWTPEAAVHGELHQARVSRQVVENRRGTK